MAKLGVNIDHVATIREARKGVEPDPVHAAVLVELAGADGITVHLREDRRHISDRDLKILRQTVKTKLNLEMAATKEMLEIALSIKPDCCTLVPEKREELTTEGGLDLNSNKAFIEKSIKTLKDANFKVSLFIDPDLDFVKASHMLGADAIEINTAKFSEAQNEKEEDEELANIINAVKMASKLNLEILAGHGLNYVNIQKIKQITDIVEYNIGHSIVSRAVFVGLEKAVRDMKELLK
ncbi:pyridoxine 5'-phosphate synthase [Thermodesulfobacteriota bacterium]